MQLFLKPTTKKITIFHKSQKYKSENAIEQTLSEISTAIHCFLYSTLTTDKNSLKCKSKYYHLIALGPSSANTTALCSTGRGARGVGGLLAHTPPAGLPWRTQCAWCWRRPGVALFQGAPHPCIFLRQTLRMLGGNAGFPIGVSGFVINPRKEGPPTGNGKRQLQNVCLLFLLSPTFL